MTENASSLSRTSAIGLETRIEAFLNRYVSSSIHLFLSMLALLVFAAAIVSTYVLMKSNFPDLWQGGDKYSALQTFIHDILLVAIAAELGLLLLFHKTSAAIEVIVFVIARKMVSPDTTASDMLFGSIALALLVFVRFYFVAGKGK